MATILEQSLYTLCYDESKRWLSKVIHEFLNFKFNLCRALYYSAFSVWHFNVFCRMNLIAQLLWCVRIFRFKTTPALAHTHLHTLILPHSVISTNRNTPTHAYKEYSAWLCLFITALSAVVEVGFFCIYFL